MGGFGPLYFQIRDVSVLMGNAPGFRMQLKRRDPRPSSTDRNHPEGKTGPHLRRGLRQESWGRGAFEHSVRRLMQLLSIPGKTPYDAPHRTQSSPRTSLDAGEGLAKAEAQSSGLSFA
jgi:hypothetical protein